MQKSGGGLQISVSIPDSVLSEKASLLLKTQVAGYIARALAIFGVNELIIYHDIKYGAKGDMELLELILKYILTPPYLRRHVFGIRRELKYVGLMPPVTIPSHTVGKGDNVRFGYVIKQQGKLFVHAGLDRPIELVDYRGRTGEIIPVAIFEVKGQKYAKPTSFVGYSGFTVKTCHNIEHLLSCIKGNSAMIFTSRFGDPISKVYTRVASEIKSKGSVNVLFGGPKIGLEEMLEGEKRGIGQWLNTIEEQQVKTVRTEEALMITLGIINLLAKI